MEKINSYEIYLKEANYGNYKETIQASTPAKAKYIHYCNNSEMFDNYMQYLNCKPSVRKIGIFKTSDLFPNLDEYFYETWEEIKKYRNIPFIELGMEVEVDGKKGSIVGTYGLNLLVCIEVNTTSSNFHPNWKTKYFDKNGNLIKEFKED